MPVKSSKKPRSFAHDWKIAGKKQSIPLEHLSITNHKITGKKAIADLLTETFSIKSNPPSKRKK